MKLSELLKQKILLSDGSMGALLASMGYKDSCPDALSVTHPEVIRGIHRSYLDAGADIVIANSFGSAEPVLSHKGYAGKSAEFTRAAVKNARAEAGSAALVAVDMGPTGEFIYPVGAHSFEDVYGWFFVQAQAAKEAGADFAYIETQTDLAECRAACLAARDAGLEAIASFSVSAKGRTLTGASVEACGVSLEAAGATAVGFNCSVGPNELVECTRRLFCVTSLPIAVQPNAGLPVMGADGSLSGGWCGTTPEHIRRLKPLSGGPVPETPKKETEYLASARQCFKAEEALSCPEDIGDPEDAYDADEDSTCLRVDASAFTPKMLLELSSYTSLPLLLHGGSADQLRALLRVYPGRAAVEGQPEAARAFGALSV